MLKELLNQKVRVGMASYANALISRTSNLFYHDGIVTDVDDNFIKFDDGMIIATKYIAYIQPL